MGRRGQFDYFGAFGEIVNQATLASDKLRTFLKDYDPSKLDAFRAEIHEIEHVSDKINHELFTALASEFITPIDREDIIECACSADNIVDYIDDATQRLYMYNIQEIDPIAIQFTEIIYQSCKELQLLMKELPNFKRSKTLHELLISINSLEEQADELYIEGNRSLMIEHADDPLYIIAWSNTFTRLERCCDSCEDLADTVHSVVMQNS